MKLDILNYAVKQFNSNNFSNIQGDEVVRELYAILKEKRVISLSKNGRIKKIKNNRVVVGPLVTKTKFGFILGDEDTYVHNIDGYFDGDFVVAIIKDEKYGSNTEGEIIGLLKRDKLSIIAKIDGDKNITPFLEKFANYSIKLEDEDQMDLFNERQVVLFDIIKVVKTKLIVNFKQVISDQNDPDLQMKLVLANYNIETEFSSEAIKEANEKAEPQEQDFAGRVDLRDKVIMTIDGKDAKDLDDAICLEQEGDNFRLYVSIADVSHYVTENSAIDIDAYSRSTSVYFVDRVVPMLPKVLSNGICSLHPNVNRLTLTCEMLINKSGKVVDSKIYQSVINSKYRLTYDEVNDVLENNLVPRLAEIEDTIRTMDHLRKILNKKRINRGSFNLEDKDAKFTVDEEGKIIDIKAFVRKNAEKLIEEFMILANETVASTIFYMQLPLVYRVHDQPNTKKLKDVLAMFSIFGIKIVSDAEDFHPSIFKKALEQLEDPISKRIVSDLIVRSLSKARYQPNNIGHFGLASKCYTHFTSPIRRYPDLIVHRRIRQYLIEANVNFSTVDDELMSAIGVQTSEKEVNAIKAEQTIEDSKKAKYMEQFIGQEFEAVIASMTDFGFFVELENTVRGLIRFGKIKEFNKAVNYKLYFSDNKILTIGDKVTVKLTEINETRGIVEFDLVGFTNLDTPIKKRPSSKVDNKKGSSKGKKPENFNSKNFRRKKVKSRRK